MAERVNEDALSVFIGMVAFSISALGSYEGLHDAEEFVMNLLASLFARELDSERLGENLEYLEDLYDRLMIEIITASAQLASES